MPRTTATAEQLRAALFARLHARRAELEQALIARVFTIADGSRSQHPEFLAGLRATLAVALDYGLAVIERGEERAPPLPVPLLAQARLSARAGIGLDTVLRRYLAGYSLLSEFVIQEAEDTGLVGAAALQRILRGQAAALDRLIAAVTEEYRREANGRIGSTEQRRAERVERLFAGELIDASELNYDLGVCHLGLIAAGPAAEQALRDLATSLDARLLLVRREEGTAWAWLGSRRQLDPADVERLLLPGRTHDVTFALGEPARGLSGWRLTHRQATAAFAVACRRHGIVRYADVALLASILHDDLLAASLRKLYLEPLAQERDGGAILRETLRAYFAADRNISSAAAALGVSRRTVANRLRAVEEKIAHPLADVAAELKAALDVQELDDTRSA